MILRLHLVTDIQLNMEKEKILFFFFLMMVPSTIFTITE